MQRMLLCLLIGCSLWVLPGSVTAKEQALNVSNTLADSRIPVLAIANDGTRHLVWEETVATSSSSTTTYLLHRTSNGIVWSPTVTVTIGFGAALATGRDATAHLVWVGEFNHALQVFYSRWTGGTWSVPRLIAPGLNGNATAPAIALDRNNTVHVAWGQAQPSYKLYYAESTAGGTGAWSATPIPNAAGSAPSMALDTNNQVHLVWQEQASGMNDIFYAQLSGSTWSLPENVSQSSQADSRSPVLGLTRENLPLVAWTETLSTQDDIQTATRTASGWTPPVNLSNSGSNSSQPRLMPTVAGWVVAWNEASAANNINWAFGHDVFWTSPQLLVTGGGDWGDVTLASDSSRRIFYAYDGGSAANGDIYYDALMLPQRYLPLIVSK